MVNLRPDALTRKKEAMRKANPRKIARINARVTNEAEFEKMLESVDGMSEPELKERLRAITGIIWAERKRIAMGRKIRRLEDLESTIHEREEGMKLDIARKKAAISSYAKEFIG